jgi:hypothetical protein
MYARQKNLELSPRRGSAFLHRHAGRRMRTVPLLRLRWSRARAHVNDIGNRIPLAIELAHLLGVDVELERDLMIVRGRPGLHPRQIKPAPRSRVQNAHQRPLSIAIVNLKNLHVCRSVNRVVLNSEI